MFWINGEQWRIKFVHPYNTTLIRSDGSYARAVTDDNDKTIYISNKEYGNQLRKIIIHEICHALLFSLNIYMTCEDEEILCQVFENYGSLVYMISRNIFCKLGI